MKEIDFIKKLMPVKGKRILELGCGIESKPSVLTELFENGAIVVGVDKYGAEVNSDGFRMICSDIMDIDDKIEGKFDLIVSCWLFAMLSSEEKEKVFEICSKYLTNEGIAVHFTSNKYFDADIQNFDIETKELDDNTKNIIIMKRKI